MMSGQLPPDEIIVVTEAMLKHGRRAACEHDWPAKPHELEAIYRAMEAERRRAAR